MSGEDIIYSPSVNKAFFEDRESVEMTKDDILRVENEYVQASIRAKMLDLMEFKFKLGIGAY